MGSGAAGPAKADEHARARNAIASTRFINSSLKKPEPDEESYIGRTGRWAFRLGSTASYTGMGEQRERED
jgi:hypothetical protein